ncbi:hypothetical protein KR084_006811 [Drosophila pseudotakahashii]|nr:hypothetical protein KR084_006811 [Drosophila pseudotakahashii]
MQRSVLLLVTFAILLCAAVALPRSLSKSEEDLLEQILAESVESGELQDLDESTGNHIIKRSAKDSSSSEEDKNGAKLKDKANSSADSSSEEKKTTGNAVHEGETTTKSSARRRREIAANAEKDQQRDQKTSEESPLDAQAEKELDEEMARAEAEILKIVDGKDNTSIEDYAQGCEVMEVSSKEANEATYAE